MDEEVLVSSLKNDKHVEGRVIKSFIKALLNFPGIFRGEEDDKHRVDRVIMNFSKLYENFGDFPKLSGNFLVKLQSRHTVRLVTDRKLDGE